MIEYWTDGAAKRNGQPDSVAGWGYVCVDKSRETIIAIKNGRIEGGTNNIGELTAIIEALKDAEKEGITDFSIHSDSSYCIRGASEWSLKWKLYNWHRNASQTEQLSNRELWIELDELMQGKNISWIKVPAHQGEAFNEIADGLAKVVIKDD